MQNVNWTLSLFHWCGLDFYGYWEAHSEEEDRYFWERESVEATAFVIVDLGKKRVGKKMNER